MTLIVGLKEKNGDVWIGGDSLSISGNYRFGRKDPKVFIKSGQYVIGFTSSYRYGQIVRHHTLLPEIEKHLVSVESREDGYSMIMEIVEEIRSKVTEYGYNKIESNQVEGGQLIIGWHNNLFVIDYDYQYSEPVNNVCAIGGGFSYALGSLYATREKTIIFDRMIEAFEVTGKYYNCIGNSFDLYQITKSDIQKFRKPSGDLDE